MGYDVHITRRDFWWDEEGEPIGADEWTAVVKGDPELEMAGAAEAAVEGGDAVLRYENPLLARMVTHPAVDTEGAWLDLREGVITVKNPDDVLLAKMKAVAALLNAKVQGDDGEDYPL
ncbi:hypothetical protein AB0K02_30465 [Streptomyces sp. NPDC049597]|uniref:hypothetical protein n=1 Tax=Streptomyces sp. NPDC049597 TaxID=3155276 RepID=UPI003415CF76